MATSYYLSTQILCDIASTFSTNLKQLDLSDCPGVLDEVVNVVVTNASKLQFLSLKFCRCVMMLRLLIHFRRLTDASCAAISSCSSLTDLNISSCRQITDKGLTALASHLIQLVSLDVSYLSNITSKSVLEVAMKCRKLRRLDLTKCKVCDNI